MSTKLRISNGIINWPNKCVRCCGVKDNVYKSTGYNVNGYYVALINYSKFIIKSPICSKCKRAIMLKRFAMFISGIVLVLSATFTLCFWVDGNEPPLICYIITCGAFILFILSYTRQPVHISDPGSYFVTVTIQNDQYAKEFASINDVME